jgi:glycine cleavage system aminomethyltransferase T
MPAITIGPRVRKSPYYDATIRHGAQAFTIYNHTYMPSAYHSDAEVAYSKLLDGAQIWDVGCERQVQITGPDTMKLAQLLTPRNLSECVDGQCKYALVTDHAGGIINDPVMLKLSDELVWFSLADSDMLLWAKAIAAGSRLDVTVDEPDVSPLQVQGPRSRHLMRDLFGPWIDELGFYRFRETELDGMPLVVARSGYSKELCYEIYLRDSRYGDKLWDRLFDVGQVHNVSAGAPNQILRVEGGLLSYNTDMDLSNNPYEINLGWTVDLDQNADFIGKKALAKIHAEGVKRRLMGAVIGGEKMTQFNEHFWPVYFDGTRVGHMTVCIYSPRLEQNLSFVMVKAELAVAGQRVEIHSPAGRLDATLCELPFIGS